MKLRAWSMRRRGAGYAKGLAREFPGSPVALYAGSGRSRPYENGSWLSKDRELIKKLVKDGTVRLFVGTDAAREGLNLRYHGSVEDKVHEALSGRLAEIFSMFGQIPDVLEDVWVDVALGSVDDAKKRIGELSWKHSFDERYGRIDQVPGWEDCSRVVNRLDKLEALRKGW